MIRYISDIVPISQLVFVIGVYLVYFTQNTYIHTYIHTYKGVLCLAESGAGKTQFVKLLLSKVHSGR
jgi:uncharacterized membrane protein